MKKQYLLLTLAFCSLAVLAQETKTENAKAAVMTFEKTAINYGTILQDSDGDRIFSFTNTGKTPLMISDVKSNCACTIPAFSKDPVEPGKSSTIKVHYDTNRLNAFNKSLTVVSNASNSPVTITITGMVNPATDSTKQIVPPAPLKYGN